MDRKDWGKGLLMDPVLPLDVYDDPAVLGLGPGLVLVHHLR